jgi:DNA-binding transcriptional LysR family regulator
MERASDLDWDDLRFFLQAARSQSLSGAARAMGVEHTTIGRRLSSLERSLGAPLVLRGPEGLRLTPLGASIARFIEEIERTVGAIGEMAASQRSRVRLACPSGFAKLVSQDLAQLRKDNPAISLEIVSGARPLDLKNGEVHLAIRLGPIADQELIARKICNAGFSLYGSDSYLARHERPSDPRNLAGHEIIGFDTVLAATPAGRWISSHDKGAAIVLHGREMADVLSAVLSGAGLAMLPCFMGDEEPSLRRLTPEVLAESPLAIVYSREVRIADPVRAVFRYLTTVLRRQARKIGGIPSAGKPAREPH